MNTEQNFLLDWFFLLLEPKHAGIKSSSVGSFCAIAIPPFLVPPVKLLM